MPETAAEFAGTPDAFGRLWTPHRAVYVSGEAKDPAACPFCEAPQRPDDEALIVHRGMMCFVLLNLYPYSPGHALVCTYRHVADYRDLTDAERVEMGALAQQTMRVIAAVSAPAGFNLGMNQGAVAGAGVADHIHQHVVPRWLGDTNFLPIIAQTRTLPAVLGDTRQLIADAWEGSC